MKYPGPQSGIVSQREAARLFKRHVNTIRRWRRAGHIHTITFDDRGSTGGGSYAVYVSIDQIKEHLNRTNGRAEEVVRGDLLQNLTFSDHILVPIPFDAAALGILKRQARAIGKRLGKDYTVEIVREAMASIKVTKR